MVYINQAVIKTAKEYADMISAQNAALKEKAELAAKRAAEETDPDKKAALFEISEMIKKSYF